MMIPRRLQSLQIRQDAAKVASLREHPTHITNGEEFQYRNQDNQPSYIANFTKGLPHNTESGLLLNCVDYQQFVSGIQSGLSQDFMNTPLGPGKLPATNGCCSIQQITCDTKNRSTIWQSQIAQETNAKVRAWESAGAGLLFDLQGYDAQSLTMPPAPRLDSAELVAEMAEVYLQALLRDLHFSQLREQNLGEVFAPPVPCPLPDLEQVTPLTKKFFMSNSAAKIKIAIKILNNISIEDRNWFNSFAYGFAELLDNPKLEKRFLKEDYLFTSIKLTEGEKNRKRHRVNVENLFRGITPGDQIGPYLSQFLIIGNPELNSNSNSPILEIMDGFIAYGSVRIDQTVRTATPCKDYMTTFDAWVDVQNGADVRGLETYVSKTKINGDRLFPTYRFMTTPRDLATYVHYDALYEAYLNACLILLGMGAPFDPGIPFQQADVKDKQQGFAHFGGPQILSLVCEVATRALKAARYQKFNTHRRLRPEALAGLIDRYKQVQKKTISLGANEIEALKPIKKLVDALDQVGLLDLVAAHNQQQNQTHSDRQKDASKDTTSYLLPMAFPEGSPMHPSYAAGHATVAGACVTIPKAFFDHGWRLDLGMEKGKYIAYEPNEKGDGLQKVLVNQPLTVEGELNKIASNISIGRNWAGVHYFTDYIESLRMGELIAIGILEEQKLTYGENFTMTIPLFDGGTIRI